MTPPIAADSAEFKIESRPIHVIPPGKLKHAPRARMAVISMKPSAAWRYAAGAALLCAAAAVLFSSAPAQPAAAPALAATPPMGWNSWDCYGTTVTEAEVKANADYMAQT